MLKVMLMAMLAIVGFAYLRAADYRHLAAFHKSHPYDEAWTESVSPQGYPVKTIHFGNREPILCVRTSDEQWRCSVPE